MMRMLRERRLELAIIVVVVVLDQVAKMLVRNALALVSRRLVRADIHAAVDKHRIRVDYLGPAPFQGVPPD